MLSKFGLFLSFLFVGLIHFFVLSSEYKKEQIKLSKPQYQKVSVQLVAVQKPVVKEVKKEVKEVVKKEIKKTKKIEKKKTRKKVLKKDIKKLAKRKIVKKELKKPIKEVKKPVKELKKEPKIKKIAKENKKSKIVKEVKKTALVNKAQTLKRFKEFKENYLTKLRAKIDENKKYPRVSRRFHEEGLVVVGFKVFKNGLFKEVSILKSSGLKRLDKAALKAIQLTKNYEPFPKNIKREFLQINLPIKFKLTN